VVLVYNQSYTSPLSGCSYASYALIHILKGGKLGGTMSEIVEAMKVVDSCVVDFCRLASRFFVHGTHCQAVLSVPWAPRGLGAC
jgi:hypothetical protein